VVLAAVAVPHSCCHPSLQVFHALKSVPRSKFRCGPEERGSMFLVKYRNEEGLDWGGLYR
jgi:hypothetical protein